MATGYGSNNNMGYFDVCTDLNMFKVKVPLNFLGTVGFSLRGEGRYLSKPIFTSARLYRFNVSLITVIIIEVILIEVKFCSIREV